MYHEFISRDNTYRNTHFFFLATAIVKDHAKRTVVVFVSERGKKRKGTAVCNICPSNKRSNMLQCNSCRQWQHSKCSGITAKDYDVNYVCPICKEKKDLRQLPPSHLENCMAIINYSKLPQVMLWDICEIILSSFMAISFV